MTAHDRVRTDLSVLHVITSLGHGGTERQLLTLVKGSAGTRLRHAVCQLGPPDDLAGELRELGCEVIRVSNRRRRRYVAAYRGVALAIARVRPDVIHSWLFHARFSACLAMDRSVPPHIASVLGTDYEAASIRGSGLSPPKMAAQRIVDVLLSRKIISYIATSEAVRTSYVRALRVSRERIRVVPCAIDPDQLRERPLARERLRRALGIPGSSYVFVNVSRLVPGKGHSELIRAFDQLARSDPSVHLVIAGNGPLQSSLHRFASGLESASRIHMIGTVDRAGDALFAGDAFVFPSYYAEGFGIALAESMLAGLPAVATDLPAVREIAGDPPCVELIPPGDVLSLAASMSHLRCQPQRSAALAAAATRHASARFTIERTIPLWIASYELAKAAAPAS